jgi:hypothetical protein
MGELVAEEGGLFAEHFLAALAVEFLLLGKDRGVVGTAMFDQMVKDAGQLVRCRGDRLRRTEPRFIRRK